MDQGFYVSMLVFAAGLRHLIRQARSETEWIGTPLFGAALGWVAVTVVADGLEGGAVLDTLSGHADPSAVRALIDGTLLIYNGSIALAITGLFLASAAWPTFDSGVLPRWTGLINYAVAAPARLRKLVLLSPGGFLPMVRQFSLRGMLMFVVPTRFTVNSFMKWLGVTGTSAQPVLELMYLGCGNERVQDRHTAV